MQSPRRDQGLRRDLARGGLFVFGASLANRALLLATAILLARLLGPAGYGVYAYALAWAVLLAMGAKLGLPQLLVREVATLQMHEDWGRLRGLLRGAGQVAMLLSIPLSLAMAAGAMWLTDSDASSLRATLLWAAALVPITALANLRSAALRGLRRFVGAELLDGLLMPGAFLAAVVVVHLIRPVSDPAEVMPLHVGAAMLTLLAGAAMLRRQLPAALRSTPPIHERRRWLSSIVPFGVLAGSRIVHRQTDILMLGLLVTAETVGVYRVAFAGALLVTLPTEALTKVLAPHIVRLHAAGPPERLQRAVTSGARWMTAAATPIAAALILGGDTVLTVAFGAEYAPGRESLAVLALAQLAAVAAGPALLLLNMTGHERRAAATFVYAAVANVVLNAALIPIFDAIGAAVATAVTMLGWSAVLCAIARRSLGIDTTILGRRRSR